jgi:PAS domain S-box-containing protein
MESQTKKQLIEQIESLRRQVAELELKKTGCKRVELAVQVVGEYAQSIVATVREPLVVLDADLKVVAASRSFFKTFQVTLEETEGQLFYDLGNHRQWDIPKLREFLEKILPDNTTFDDFEVQHDFPIIGHRTMLLNARRIYNEANRPALILLAIEDITERKEMEEKLLRSERLATLGKFSGSISHELRNPLGVIASSAYYLKVKLRDADQKIVEHLDRIESSVGSSIAIIESLLNLTRMEEPQLARLDLAAITHDIIATSEVPDNVNIIQNFPEQEVLVDADREQLAMAFRNIIKNTIEVMDGKGTLTVAIRTTADGQAEVSFADTGPGIAPENLDRVFQPLFSTKAKGIGFGLSISKMIIDRHGGAIEAKSEPEKGATIIIQLPLHTGKDKEV